MRTRYSGRLSWSSRSGSPVPRPPDNPEVPDGSTDTSGLPTGTASGRAGHWKRARDALLLTQRHPDG
jgi:hypothetical protein